MIIKKIQIRNFRSYYGNNELEIDPGLTLIIGGNGDGKTSLFEALQWLFDTTVLSNKNNIYNFSEMRKCELLTNESDEVRVAVDFEHDGEKRIEKYFSVTCVSEGKYNSGAVTYRGFEGNGIERHQVDGKTLMDRVYDAFVQRFSMFKGESTLNVFHQPELVNQLVNNFSQVRDFDTLTDWTESFSKKSNKQFLAESKKDAAIANEASELEEKIDNILEDIKAKKQEIRDKKDSLELYNKRLSDYEGTEAASGKFKEVSDDLKSKKDEAAKLRARCTRTNFNTALLDKLWILCGFTTVYDEFKKKVASLGKEKRQQEKDFLEQRSRELGKLEGRKEVITALQNGATSLPWDMPDEASMEEMLHDQICKVCGRPAPKGSEAYMFMLHKLEEFRRHIKETEEKEQERKIIESKELFKYQYIEFLTHLSYALGGQREANLNAIPSEINDEIDFVAERSKDLEHVNKEIQDLEDEKARILIQAGNVSEAVMEKNFKDIRGLFDQKERAAVRITELNDQLNTLVTAKETLEKQFEGLNPSSASVKRFRDVHATFEAIAKAFKRAQDENLRRFLVEVEERSNKKLKQLSAGDFHGIIHFSRSLASDEISIQLKSSNGTEIVNMSESQETVMYMAILFAISDFTQEKRDEVYPLIFDAATSSFGDEKEGGFYNVINSVGKQCIIITKDYLTKGKLREDDVNTLNCSVYRIKKMEGFDDEDLSTIRTNITKIK